ncbi:metallophosphoesterase [Planctomycetaceae bacterium SCGC AG-212-D15]|nr:metallophosphoesterase [Planctomycetaceae bacterium SCGC AG-212-D15]
MPNSPSVRLAAVGDLHCTVHNAASFRPLFQHAREHADILVLCGDLTDLGLVEEAQALTRALAGVGIPMLAVLGNHDYHSGHQEEIRRVLSDAGVQMLNGDSAEVRGIGFAGVKGFVGGFGRRLLEPWGEDTVKLLVREAAEEALKLESALARLRTTHSIVVLHYAPIAGTVEGEPEQIFPFLGSGRLEDPINRHPVTAVFHGHAHHGRLEGRTSNGTPVYNVSLPLLRATFGERPPLRILELSASPSAPSVSRVTQVGPALGPDSRSGAK